MKNKLLSLFGVGLISMSSACASNFGLKFNYEGRQVTYNISKDEMTLEYEGNDGRQVVFVDENKDYLLDSMKLGSEELNWETHPRILFLSQMDYSFFVSDLKKHIGAKEEGELEEKLREVWNKNYKK